MTTIRSYLQARKQYLPSILLAVCVIFYLPYSYISMLNAKEEHLKNLLSHPGFKRVANRSHVLFSAYLDDRFPGEPAKIRILGFKDKKDDQPLYCKLYFQNHEAMCINSPAIELSLDAKTTNHTDVEYMFHCALPPQASTLPVAVSLSSSKYCASTEHAVPIFILQGKSDRKNDIAVCFSSPSSQLNFRNRNEVVEILELSKHFGASVVQMYNESIHSDLLASLKKYINSGFLKILDWKLDERVPPYRAQTLSNNDCIYHNMRSFKNIVFVDKDEIIVPSLSFNSSWKALIDQAHKMKPDAGAFWFQDIIHVTKEGLPMNSKNKHAQSSAPKNCTLNSLPYKNLPRIFTHRFVALDEAANAGDKYRQFIVDPAVVLYVDVDKTITFLPGKKSHHLPHESGQAIRFMSYKNINNLSVTETFRSKERVKLTHEIYEKLDFTPKINLTGC